MALTDSQKTSALDKKSLGKSSTDTTRDFFEEPYNGRAAVLPSQVWLEAEDIPTTAPVLAPDAISGVVQYKEDLALTAVPGTTDAFYHADLVDAIPFNFGDGSYNYVLKDSGASNIPFGTNDWRLDPDTGVVYFYGGAPANMPPTVSFYKYVGEKGVGGAGGGGAGNVNWALNPYFIDDLDGVTESDAVNFAASITTSASEVQFPHVSENSLKISKAASDESGEYIDFDDNSNLGVSLPLQSLAVVKVQIDTTLDTNYVDESFYIDVVDENGDSIAYAGTVSVEAESNKEYQILINPNGVTEIHPRIYCEDTNTTAYTVIVGFVGIERLTQSLVGIEKDAESYVATLSNGTNVTQTRLVYKYISDNVIMIHGKFDVTGTGSGGTFSFSLPSGLTFDTSLNDSTAEDSILGSAQWLESGVQREILSVQKATGDNIQFGRGSAGVINGSNFSSGDSISWTCFCFVNEKLEKSVVTNYELGLSSASMRAYRSGALSTSSTSVQDMIYDELEEAARFIDYNTTTGEATVRKTGKYWVNAQYGTSALDQEVYGIYITDASNTVLAEKEITAAKNGQDVYPSITKLMSFNKNDVFKIRRKASTSSSRTIINDAIASFFNVTAHDEKSIYNAIQGSEFVSSSHTSNGPNTTGAATWQDSGATIDIVKETFYDIKYNANLTFVYGSGSSYRTAIMALRDSLGNVVARTEQGMGTFQSIASLDDVGLPVSHSADKVFLAVGTYKLSYQVSVLPAVAVVRTEAGVAAPIYISAKES